MHHLGDRFDATFSPATREVFLLARSVSPSIAEHRSGGIPVEGRDPEREKKRETPFFIPRSEPRGFPRDAMMPGGFRIPSREADARAYVRESRRETTQEKVPIASSSSCPPFLFLSFALSLSLHPAYRNEVYALHLSVQSGLGKERRIMIAGRHRRRRRCCIRQCSR